MSSTASELNALAACSYLDIYRNNFKVKSNYSDLQMSKFMTLIWGLIAIIFALAATLAENLIQLVNIIGSIFYGTILGIFLVGFFFKKIQDTFDTISDNRIEISNCMSKNCYNKNSDSLSYLEDKHKKYKSLNDKDKLTYAKVIQDDEEDISDIEDININ